MDQNSYSENDNDSISSMMTSDCNEGDINDNVSIQSDSRDVVVEDKCIEQFKSCQKEVSCDDYNNLMQRYIQCETVSKGDGIRRIVACEFAMNLTSEFSAITYKEAFYHL